MNIQFKTIRPFGLLNCYSVVNQNLFRNSSSMFLCQSGDFTCTDIPLIMLLIHNSQYHFLLLWNQKKKKIVLSLAYNDDDDRESKSIDEKLFKFSSCKLTSHNISFRALSVVVKTNYENCLKITSELSTKMKNYWWTIA